MLKLIFTFTFIPLAELTILIKLSDVTSITFTLVLVGITGLVGAYLAKKQGRGVLKKINNSLAQGVMPAESLIEGMIIFIGGTLLITPGIMTDLAGFACILPWTRPTVKKLTKSRLSNLIQSGKFQFTNQEKKETKSVEIIKEEQEE